MIRFKQFDISDIHYAEQIEQFQKEHPSAEFVQITDGCTTYEKIWFKYDDSIEQTELNENQKLVLNWLKEEMKKENMFPISCLWKLQSWHAPKNVCNAYLSLDKDRQFQLLSSFSEWFEQEEK
ncbi:hypothetical protein [Enterococcus faecalis]|uniref:hypothetical protein n=1 Tax=Enterococcus faecalis TaxID=1351 RepID=UPI0021E0A3CD|nr:hypothetical protein [Enterococcus faecalis]EJB2752913.1 hypothetical protein [Enterococcus faecalis]EKZ0433600.1 hypothetical protein [Enterococcus faecalis]MCU9782001.1 hypothetical protein [Enterococcus faecalis]MCU9796605.1 hypothetical protein [Enterococcus faecalis]